MPGGYIGVDVFFVISGFLITAHIVREVETTGRLRIAQFWARRARRLLPASLLTLLATAIGVAALAPESLWRQFYGEIVAATLYVQNWRLASDAVDYLGAENSPSPVQHYWTLSTEEQFYVALPLVVLACVVIARRLGKRPRRVVLVALVLLGAASFIYSASLTTSSPGTAYFSTLTRGWEFAAGGLLALLASTRSARWNGTLAAVGVAGITAAAVLLDSSTAFPGYAAVLPVVGSLLAIAHGERTSLSRVGAWSPVALVGRLSFGIYLWHFPLIVLLPYATGRDLGTIDKIGIAGTSLLLAYLSTRFVEDPVRFSPRLLARRRPAVVAAFSILGMVVVAGLGATGLAVENRQTERAGQLAKQILAGTPDCLGAQARDPHASPCENPDLDGVLLPDPATRVKDDANRAECWFTGSSQSRV